MSRTASHSVEVIAENLPNPRPLQSDTAHIVIRDFDDFREREHTGLRRMSQLLEGNLMRKYLLCNLLRKSRLINLRENDLAESFNEFDDGITVKPGGAGKDAINGHNDALRAGLPD